jgi:putative photosynthetic complex assembly protein
MERHHDQTVPRGALFGAAALMLLTLGLAANARREHLSAPTTVHEPPLESLEVNFQDRPDGTLAVIDAATGRELTEVPPGTNGFVRGVLRGMFRRRKLESLGHDARFLLSREADGRLTLEDPETSRRIDLDSFGPTNSTAFANFLAARARQ